MSRTALARRLGVVYSPGVKEDSPPVRPASPDISRIVLIALLGLMVVSAPYFIYRGQDGVREYWGRPISDFPVFYHAGALLLTPDRDALYDPERAGEVQGPNRRAIGRFYNPPGLGLVYSPLTLFDRSTARLVFLGISVAAWVGIAALGRLWTRDRLALALTVVAVAAFLPAYDVLYLGHPTLLFGLASGLGVLALATGRSVFAGVAAAALGLKPSLALYPWLYVLWRRRRVEVAALAATAALLVLLPLVALTGPASLLDYRALLSDSAGDAFRFQGQTTGGANLMFNWNGFISRLTLDDPPVAAVLPLYAATFAVAAYVWLRGTVTEAWLASAIATVIAIPHLLYYDWVIALPAALAAAYVTRDRWFLAVLVGLHLAANLTTLQYFDGSLGDPAFVLATPYAFGVLLYMASAARHRARAESMEPMAVQTP